MQYQETVCSGKNLRQDCTYAGKDPLFVLTGKQDKTEKEIRVPITKDLLSKHILLIGGIGSGKTNTFKEMIRNIRDNFTEEDVMVIFDTKGDYYEEFYRRGDIVISNDDKACGENGPDYWNIFKEIAADGRMVENILEISKTLFLEKLEHSSQPFFPTAAKDLFSALLMELLRNPDRENMRNNASLRNLLNSFSVSAMKRILAHHHDLRAMITYIDDPDSGQTQGVAAELQQLIREIFVGNFAKRGTLSMRELIRRKGGRVIFIEYDLSIGETLAPIFRLLVDLAIKEALCRTEEDGKKGSVYFILDEFRLLPHLNHVDNGVNFGRSLGAKFIVGVQNVDQVAAAYGEKEASSLLSGFSTTFAFRVNDKASRDHIIGLYGENLQIKTFSRPDILAAPPQVELRDCHVIKDSDITSLKPGEAIVGIMDNEPFKVLFDLYRSRTGKE